ncbi:DUF4297 domain-containing protein [Bradyrhizobium sp. 83012]|uniref:DUF4297 domain-containing protein n=1 Tax=Bradyrhizobium aeschynomenes TaxID=2734909 RepID=A0ABX2CAU8_9BRAD|nr:DUF4297 domain-containing protein [Bradyrhizobium aeschynomenes]
MSFADRLISEPQREKSGETGYERFDYQALWALALIFAHHGSSADYAIAFEFHDDIVLLDSEQSPSRARFYQVKTRDKGHWTLADLYRRKAKKDDPVGGKLPSFMGKLFSNYVLFPNETEQLNFVSNIPCAFLPSASGACQLVTCDANTLKDFMSRLVQEHPGATSAAVSLIHYIQADLSLHDSSAHIKGKLIEFILEQIGSVEFNPDTLYKTIVEECRTRSKYTGSISSFADLIQKKSITRSQVEGWLDLVRNRQALPEWSIISQKMSVGAMELASLTREWQRYRAVALDVGNEAINVLRDKIRSELEKRAGGSHALEELVNEIYLEIKDFGRSNISPFNSARLKVMILYEVFTYEAAGEVQTIDPEPAEAQS